MPTTPARIAIMGATATGKTGLALQLGELLDAEVVSMDSRQVYRRFDIGTAKPTPEELAALPHHLIDILDPDQVHSAGAHLRLCRAALDDIHRRDRVAMLAGGTGLYFRALYRGLIDVEIPDGLRAKIRGELDARSTGEIREELARVDSQRAAGLEANDRVRIQRALEIYRATGRSFSEHVAEQSVMGEQISLAVVLSCARDKLRERIAARTREMFQRGWREEVEQLLASGVKSSDPAMNSLGYPKIAEAVRNGDTSDTVMAAVIQETQQYAKRQETFFRSVDGAVWLDVERHNLIAEIRKQPLLQALL